jgi:hypothetical protein
MLVAVEVHQRAPAGRITWPLGYQTIAELCSTRPGAGAGGARNHGARLTLRHRAASIAGEFVRGPQPLALRTSSWWTKNSLRSTADSVRLRLSHYRRRGHPLT